MQSIFARCAAIVALVWLPGLALAQYGTPQSLKDEVVAGESLSFASEPKELGGTTGMANGLFAHPLKAGEKLPAIVMLHTCGGLSLHIRDWAQEATRAGYVVLTPDSMRGMTNDCGSPPKTANGRLVKDALDGVAHLAALPFVDANRISVMGFSRGAFMATWVASKAVADAVRPGTPAVAASVAMYGLCGLESTRGRPQGAVVLQPDTSRPLLMLLGGQDTETPPNMCLDMLPKLKDAGAPVQWHLYPEATHCWDCSENNGFTKTAFNGQRVTYQFNKAVTDDSRKRVFDFLATAGRR